MPMDGLHECNVLQSTDLVHGAQTGMVAGAALGCAVGGAAAYFLLGESRLQIPIVIGAALVGALLGAWFSSMVGSALPNSRLKQFESMIAEGKLLLMVDVPEHSVEQVKLRVGRDHPEAVSGGTDPHIPVFP
jgi:membrane protein DedA with SNARE-associated domain